MTTLQSVKIILAYKATIMKSYTMCLIVYEVITTNMDNMIVDGGTCVASSEL